MQDQNEKLFSPHNAPALELCVHFKSTERTDKGNKARTEEGDQFHKDCKAIFKSEKRMQDLPKARRDRIRWAVFIQRKYCPRPRGVEQVVDLYDEAGEWVTNGTVDIVGPGVWEGQEVPVIIDWKPGDYIDRWAQMYCYALGFMDRANKEHCLGVLAYYKDCKEEWRVITYAEAEQRVMRLVARLRGETGPEFYSINEWCGFCAVRLSEAGCPAWEEHKALLAETGWPTELNARIAAIKNDPVKVAQFIIADRRWRALVDAHDLDAIIRPELEKAPGGKAYGLKLQSRGYSIVIDTSAPTQEPKQLEGGNEN